MAFEQFNPNDIFEGIKERITNMENDNNVTTRYSPKKVIDTLLVNKKEIDELKNTIIGKLTKEYSRDLGDAENVLNLFISDLMNSKYFKDLTPEEGNQFIISGLGEISEDDSFWNKVLLNRSKNNSDNNIQNNQDTPENIQITDIIRDYSRDELKRKNNYIVTKVSNTFGIAIEKANDWCLKMKQSLSEQGVIDEEQQNEYLDDFLSNEELQYYAEMCRHIPEDNYEGGYNQPQTVYENPENEEPIIVGKNGVHNIRILTSGMVAAGHIIGRGMGEVVGNIPLTPSQIKNDTENRTNAMLDLIFDSFIKNGKIVGTTNMGISDELSNTIVGSYVLQVDREIQNYLLDKNNLLHGTEFSDFYNKKVNNWPEEENNKEEEYKFLEYSEIVTNITKDAIKYYRIYYKFLLEKERKIKKLPDELKKQKESLELLFNFMNRRVINYERKKEQEKPILKRRRERPQIRETKDGISGDLKSLDPLDIIRGNESIRDYVFGINNSENSNTSNMLRPEHITIDKLKDSGDYETLFNEILKNDNDFKIYRDYFDTTGSIKNIDNDGLPIGEDDMEKLKEIKEDIEAKILSIKRKENFGKFIEERRAQGKEKVDETSDRMCAMVCCIRAITSFFDTTNNNGENFASQFQLSNVNENIKFYEESGNKILSVQGMINGKYVKLYYNVDKGELLFDEFLAYDNSTYEYKIGKNDNEKFRKCIINNLPTLGYMESISKNHHFDVSSRLGFDYIKTTTLLNSQYIRNNAFLSDGGVNLEVNKLIVKNFNEKNILEQEIVSCIYGKFYEGNILFDGDNPFVIGKSKPGQYKMIELIHNSINRYRSDTNQLLKFRNCITKLGNMLQDEKNLRKEGGCPLLKYLFLNNPQNEYEESYDSYDETYDILKEENNVALKDMNKTLQNDKILVSTNQTKVDKDINFYTLLDMFAEGIEKKHINIEVFEEILAIIEKNDGSDNNIDPLSNYTGNNIFTEKYPVRKVDNGIIE